MSKVIKNHHDERGMSTIQIAIGIMVTVIMLLGAIGGYQYVNQGKASNEVQMWSDIKAATVKYGQSSGTFVAGNMTLSIVNGLGFFGSSTLNNSGTIAAPVINNQWGGLMTVAIGTAVNAGDSIAFTQTNVPSAACVDVGAKLDNIAAIISVNGVPTKTAPGVATNMALLTTNCNAAANVPMIVTITK